MAKTPKLKLIPLTDPNGQGLAPFEVEESILFGRDAKCECVLADQNVSRRHARITRTPKGYEIEDLKSSNGTAVNNRKVEKVLLRHSDVIDLGPFQFKAELGDGKKKETPPSAVSSRPARSAASDALIELKKQIHEQILYRMDLKRMDMGDDSEELREKTREAVVAVLGEKGMELPPGVDRDQLIREILDEALGLGCLEEFLDDPAITEIMVNHKDQIFIEQKGKLVLSDRRFVSEAQVRAIIERIVAPLGRRIDESTPLVDARLKDGSRVNAIIPPLALKGCSITIRKFSKTPFTIQNLIDFDTLTRDMADFLELCVHNRRNIVISGGTGSGKTTLLNVVSAFIPGDERIVTVEDAAELKLPQVHVVSLETRPPNIEGKGAITIRDLVRNCLRMRPDRIVVGECRGAEALDMLQAMNTGHDGSLTTGHANSPRDMLSRLETMVLMAGMELPSRAIREQISSAVSMIVQQSRFPDGSRKITHITEITGMEDNVITMQDIFVFKQTGFDKDGKVQGYFTPTGNIPLFVEELKSRGIPIRMELFEEKEPA